MQADHRVSGNSVWIGAEGLGQTLKVLHVTDSHISGDGETEAPFDNYSARMHDAYSQYDRKGAFQRAMDLAVAERVDLIALTGDQVNYPSTSSVEFVRREIERTGIPHLYTSGNHDWHYEGMPGSLDALRAVWRAERLKPLYADSESLSFAALNLKGVRFIAIENGTSQVDEAQLDFFEAQILEGLPTVLLVHIPLCVPGLLGQTDGSPMCGDPTWGAETDRNFVIERRERWPTTGNRPSTMAFVEAVRRAENLVGVLCGHIHQHSEDALNENAVQYVTKPGFDEGYRLVIIGPKEG